VIADSAETAGFDPDELGFLFQANGQFTPTAAFFLHTLRHRCAVQQSVVRT
jgi:hypothetical protein